MLDVLIEKGVTNMENDIIENGLKVIFANWKTLKMKMLRWKSSKLHEWKLI